MEMKPSPRGVQPPVRRLECACCGADAGRWRQWYNRDTGYGVCRKCVDWLIGRGETADEIRDCYGISGVHYAPAAEQTAQQIAGGTQP